jgi:hypothetical protein
MILDSTRYNKKKAKLKIAANLNIISSGFDLWTTHTIPAVSTHPRQSFRRTK